MSLFLTDAELQQFTGRRMKSKQIEWLKAEGIPFRRSATGHPVVTRATVEGRLEPAHLAQKPTSGWVPRVVGA
ncbi:DUF4224 domain-containing protein [Variovorax sp. J31P207]|uniref:DUF4224 domain-containing protein n=1 Tax=Variovorax sp. J31P207 TaxID=3053510 RepID=UPI002576FD38|nr:DUF4224 domain-containing protein [Variovorax sp. J31P207]MDM0072084.1 DUF4224 domain-containing protein [Variovorax sp. J31P207]